jgi:hypothetical protein
MVARCVRYVDGSRVLWGPAGRAPRLRMGAPAPESDQRPPRVCLIPASDTALRSCRLRSGPIAAPADEPLRVATAPLTMRTQDVDCL